YEDAGAEPQALRAGGDPRQPDQRVRDVRGLSAGHATVPRVRVLRAVALRHHDVLDGPDRLEPGRLGRLGQGHGALGGGERTDVGEHEAELHGTLLLAGGFRPERRAQLVRMSTGRLTWEKKSLPL